MVNSIITACPFKDCHFLYKNTDDKAEKDWDLDNQYNPVDVDNNTFSIRLKGSTKRDSLCDKPDRHIVKLIFALTFHKLKIK